MYKSKNQRMVTISMVLIFVFAVLSALSIFSYNYYSKKAKEEAEEKAHKERTGISEEVKNVNHSLKKETIENKKHYDSILFEIGKSHSASVKEITKAIHESKEELKNNTQSIVVDPYIHLAPNGIYMVSPEDIKKPEKGYDENFNHYRILFDRNPAIAANIKIDTKLLFEFKDKSEIEYEMHPLELFDNLDEFPIGKIDAPLGRSMKTINVLNLYVYLKGTYTNFSGTNSYKIDKLYRFNPESNKTMQPVKDREKILGIIEKLGGN